MKHPSYEQNAARAAFMEKLFFLDGRDKEDHPQHGLYTGLNEEILLYKKLCKELKIYEKWNKRNYPYGET